MLPRVRSEGRARIWAFWIGLGEGDPRWGCGLRCCPKGVQGYGRNLTVDEFVVHRDCRVDDQDKTEVVGSGGWSGTQTKPDTGERREGEGQDVFMRT